MKCPKCKGTKYLREKRMGGKITCQSCSFSNNDYLDWIQDSEDRKVEYVKFKIEQAFEGWLSVFIDEQKKSGIDPEFLDRIHSAEFIKGMIHESFIAGIHWAPELEKDIENTIFAEG